MLCQECGYAVENIQYTYKSRKSLDFETSIKQIPTMTYIRQSASAKKSMSQNDIEEAANEKHHLKASMIRICDTGVLISSKMYR
uniref:Uncharacterized protein n=1 Tax=Romanomermis culicivorax TaxID=13658 RepID=A0A915L8H4_ROMCU